MTVSRGAFNFKRLTLEVPSMSSLLHATLCLFLSPLNHYDFTRASKHPDLVPSAPRDEPIHPSLTCEAIYELPCEQAVLISASSSTDVALTAKQPWNL